MNRSPVLRLPHRSFPRGTSAALRAAGARRRLWPALLFVCALLFALLAAQAHALAHELAHWHVQPPATDLCPDCLQGDALDTPLATLPSLPVVSPSFLAPTAEAFAGHLPAPAFAPKARAPPA